jgi:hypothetical protein
LPDADEQGAWWQVDLGSKKNIKQIIIYNRTDCCANRLSNYQVSISNKADFSTHTQPVIETLLLRFLYLKINAYNLNFC